MNILTDSQIDTGPLEGQRVAVLGYGNQGRAQALNLKDWGKAEVRVGLRRGSPSQDRAEADGFAVMECGAAAGWADIGVILTPDETHAALYTGAVAPQMAAGGLVLFAHGLAVHFGQIEPRPDLDIALVCPKGPGTTVRAAFQAGGGLPCLFAVHRDVSGQGRSRALAYAKAIGSARAGVVESSFGEECVANLFSEQAVHIGGLVGLIRAGWETLVKAGVQPEVAYFECVNNLKLIADLIYSHGEKGMYRLISNTAEYAAYRGRDRIIGPEAKTAMAESLTEIESGTFASDWLTVAQEPAAWRTPSQPTDEDAFEAAGAAVRRLLAGPARKSNI